MEKNILKKNTSEFHGIKSKETVNKKENINELEDDFERISRNLVKFNRVFFEKIGTYMLIYFAWLLLSKIIPNGIENLKIKKGFRVVFAALAIGSMSIVDGKVTSSFKTPFNQLCYSINKSVYLNDEQKDNFINNLTITSEIPKEVLKKFGIMSIGSEIIKVIVRLEDIWNIELYISLGHLIPLFYSYYLSKIVEKKLIKVKDDLVSKL